MQRPDNQPSPLGQFIKRWRKLRGSSQLDLSFEANVSTRHLSFIESGRSKPSAQMVLILAKALDVPLREQNDMLALAGFAPVFQESRLTEPELAPIRQAIELILDQHEPFPAVVMDRYWNVNLRNGAAKAFFSGLLGAPRSAQPEAAPNILRMMFDPTGLRPYVRNWEEVARSLIVRVRHEAIGGVLDREAQELLDEVLGYPGVPPNLRRGVESEPPTPLVPVQFEKQGVCHEVFSAVTTLGTPRDITLQEIRIECFYPANEETRRRMLGKA